jgi:hypothetical protein
MIIALRPSIILRPSVVSMIAMLASLAAWLFPSFGVLRKGFESSARLSLDAFVVLACWYLLIFICFSLGEKVGSFLIPRRNRATEISLDLNSDLIYYAFTILSAIGTITTLIRVFQALPAEEAIFAITLGQANALKDALYENYSIGLVSLRYLILYSASLALYRIIRFRSFAPINLFNVFMLGVGTFLASRLIFIATFLTVMFLLSFGKSSTRINIPKLLTLAALLFLLLAVLNYSRNKNYYDQNNLSFGLAGVSEILAYVGSPFQAEIGAAGATDDLVAGGDQTYRNYVDEEENLMTNSAFIHLHEQIGYSTWPYMAGMCLFMGFVFEALASLGKTIFLLPCGAILYASAELWRLDLFQQGTFIVWFVFGVGLPASLYALRSLFALASDSPENDRLSW